MQPMQPMQYQPMQQNGSYYYPQPFQQGGRGRNGGGGGGRFNNNNNTNKNNNNGGSSDVKDLVTLIRTREEREAEDKRLQLLKQEKDAEEARRKAELQDLISGMQSNTQKLIDAQKEQHEAAIASLKKVVDTPVKRGSADPGASSSTGVKKPRVATADPHEAELAALLNDSDEEEEDEADGVYVEATAAELVNFSTTVNFDQPKLNRLRTDLDLQDIYDENVFRAPMRAKAVLARCYAETTGDRQEWTQTFADLTHARSKSKWTRKELILRTAHYSFQRA